MINEGGAGFLYYDYDLKEPEPKQIVKHPTNWEIGDNK